MNTIWVVEAKCSFPFGGKWIPMFMSVNGKSTIFRTRAGARKAAKVWFETNRYNHLEDKLIVVKYRATRYRAER